MREEEDCQISKPRNLALFFFKLMIYILSSVRLRPNTLFKKLETSFLISRESFLVPQTKMINLFTYLTYTIFRLIPLHIKRLIPFSSANLYFNLLSLFKNFHFLRLPFISQTLSASRISESEAFKNETNS